MGESSRLEISYDHYKDTFASIRERERERDRLFVYLIVAFAGLGIEVLYPAQFEGTVEAVSFGGLAIPFGALPAAALLSATWVLVSVIALRYFQRVKWIEQQYDYLHGLEAALEPHVQDVAPFHREGAGYLGNAPPFQDWAWILYVLVFPATALVATLALLAVEWTLLHYHPVHTFIDTAMAATLLISIYLYQLHPPREIAKRLKRAFNRG